MNNDDDDIIDAEVVSFGSSNSPHIEPKSLPGGGGSGGKGPPLCLIWQMLRKTLNTTFRETQVVRGIYQGHKHRVIADELVMSKHTVSIHWRHAQTAMKRKGRIEVIAHINEILTQRRIEEAVEAATRPLREEIETLRQRLRT